MPKSKKLATQTVQVKKQPKSIKKVVFLSTEIPKSLTPLKLNRNVSLCPIRRDLSKSKKDRPQSPTESTSSGAWSIPYESNLLFGKSDLTEQEDAKYQEILALPFISMERLTQLRRLADDCIKKHRVFVVHGGYEGVRQALLDRGWREKFELQSRRSPVTTHSAIPVRVKDQHDLPKSDGNYTLDQIRICEKIIMSLMLSSSEPHFYWSTIQLTDLPPYTLYNRVDKSWFTCKWGLSSLLQRRHWFIEPGVSEVQFPRCYHMTDIEEIEQFSKDFRLTACICVLKYFVHTINVKGPLAVRCPSGSICMHLIEFAMARCHEFINSMNHQDIDAECGFKVEEAWKLFLDYHYLFISEKLKLSEDQSITTLALKQSAETTLNEISGYWPQFYMDGMQNLWIIKPENQTQGQGIQILNSMEKIGLFTNYITKNNFRNSKYVIQKYIERPLLIHATKFDIRQWFLVTSVEPLIIWMYKDSYLRFCSYKYTLLNLHESIHLTNNAVQKKYENGFRHNAIPPDNMWDSDMFASYLTDNGQAGTWQNVIYSGMKRAIICALLSSQDGLIHRNNSFQLYGADFILDEDYVPWLLEINQSPELSGTSSVVTARLCPRCLADVIKVVVDFPMDRDSDTGAFEMIYKQHAPLLASVNTKELHLKGARIMNTCKVGENYRRAYVHLPSAFEVDDVVRIDWSTCPKTPANYFNCGVQIVADKKIAEHTERQIWRGHRFEMNQAKLPNSMEELHRSERKHKWQRFGYRSKLEGYYGRVQKPRLVSSFLAKPKLLVPAIPVLKSALPPPASRCQPSDLKRKATARHSKWKRVRRKHKTRKTTLTPDEIVTAETLAVFLNKVIELPTVTSPNTNT